MLSVKTKSVRWKAKQIFRLVLSHASCACLIALCCVAACGSDAAARRARSRFRALVFTKTTGFRHDSIPAGVARDPAARPRHRFSVDTTARRRAGSPARTCARYDVVIFLSTTGTPIKRRSQQRALRGLHPPRRRLRRRPRRVGHARRLALVRAPRRRALQAPRPRHRRAATVHVDDRDDRRDPRPPGPVGTHRRVVRVPLGPAARARARAPRRGASARLVPPLRWRPLGVHRDGTYQGVLRRAALRRPPARGDRDGRRPREVRLCAVSVSRARA